MSRKFVLAATLLLVLSVILSSCKPAEKLESSINLNWTTEPPTMDPGLATDTTSVDCVNMLFMGLTKLDIETVVAKPYLATEWSVSADGLVWTFKMRKDISWIRWDPATQKAEKKRPVVAGDIVYAVRRVANPETASDYAYVDYIIKGVQAVNTGESTDLESIGVRAVDDYTVEFTLTQPAGYFPAIAGMWTNTAVPREVIEQFGDKWLEPGNIWTFGPAVLDVWEHESKVVFKKNPTWFDAKNVSIQTSTSRWSMMMLRLWPCTRMASWMYRLRRWPTWTVSRPTPRSARNCTSAPAPAPTTMALTPASRHWTM